MKTFCAECGHKHQYDSNLDRPKFCCYCGIPFNQVIAKKVVAPAIEEEEEEEEYEEISVPKNIRISIEGIGSQILDLGKTMNQSATSQKSLRPARPLEKIQKIVKNDQIDI